MPSLTTMHIMGPSKNQERQKRSQDQIYSSKIWQKYSEVELKRFNWPVVICMGIATWRGPIPELLKVPWYYIFSAWVKITTRQGKLQGKSVTRRVCLSFASATPTYNCWSIIEQKNFADFRWSVGPGSRLLMCSTGKHGTNTWARWQFSNWLLRQAFDIFLLIQTFQLLLGAIWPPQYAWQRVSKTTGVQIYLNLGNWSLIMRRPPLIGHLNLILWTRCVQQNIGK